MKYAMLIFAIFACITATTDAHQNVDLKCVKDCTTQGLSYSYCYTSCLYDENPSQQQNPISQPTNQQQNAISHPSTSQEPQKSKVDQKCMNDCQDRGYVADFCLHQCSF